MNELLRNEEVKRNYYALFIAITKGETAKDALTDMGICPDNDIQRGRINNMKRKVIGLILVAIAIVSYLLTNANANVFFLWVGLLLMLYPGGVKRND